MKFVSIIILNYNGKQFNKACIDSVLQQNYQDFEIIFVDNSSTDRSLEEVKEIYKKQIENKKIIVIENKENTGFAGGNNKGVEYTDKKSEYICLLNNDTTVPENRLKELIKGISSDINLGGVSSLILDRGNEKDIEKQVFKKREIFTNNIFGETTLKNYPEVDLTNKRVYTSALSGCCLLYKKKIISKPFEDYYFAYAEDVYLSLYLIKRGFKLAYCLNSVVHHVGSGSFGKNPSKVKLFHGNKNQIINFLIFYSYKEILLLLPLFIIKEISHIFFSNPLERIIAKTNSRIWIIKNYKTIKKTKGEIYKTTKIKNRQFLKQLSYKMVDADIFCFNFSGFQKKIIKITNGFFSIYIKYIINFLK